MPTNPNLDGRPLQWDDLQPRGRKIVSDNIRQTGQDLPKIATQSADRLQATNERTGNKVAGVKAKSTRAVAEHLESKPVSLRTAANSRQRLYDRGLEDRRTQNPEDPHQVIPTGAGWYFDHHKEIAGSAERHGVPHDWAIAASGVMSPLNSPENERASVSALMDANANHTVHVTEKVHDHLASAGIDVSDHLGKTVHMDQLPPGSIAHLSDSKIRGDVKTGANLSDVARGGTRQNITKAERILAGDVHPDDAVDPHSAPKVWSYIHNTRQAVPNSATHVEYMGRVHQDALARNGHIDPQQQALDLYGHAGKDLPRDHLLSPRSNTVEDTWQNAATFDQPKTMAGGKTSVFKAAGSMPETYPVQGVKTTTNPQTGKRESAHTDSRIGNSALTHAFNNRATQKAAEQQGRASGVSVPPVAVQEVGWTQMRKDAGKDPEFNQRATEKPDPYKGEVRGQLALFGEHVPGGEYQRGVPEQMDLTPGQAEKELRAHEAIHQARRMKDRRLRGLG
jgi:hypothetical protein